MPTISARRPPTAPGSKAAPARRGPPDDSRGSGRGADRPHAAPGEAPEGIGIRRRQDDEVANARVDERLQLSALRRRRCGQQTEIGRRGLLDVRRFPPGIDDQRVEALARAANRGRVVRRAEEGPDLCVSCRERLYHLPPLPAYQDGWVRLLDRLRLAGRVVQPVESE